MSSPSGSELAAAEAVAAEFVAALPAWQALTQGVAWYTRPTASVLALEDDDRVDFLQRMTTNNIAALQTGQAAVTVLTSPTARVVQVFTVLRRANDLLLLTAPGEGEALEKHLRGQIFFMDKVRVSNLSAGFSRLRLVGPMAANAAATLGAPASLADGAWVEADGRLLLRDDRYELPGFELLVPVGEAAATIDRLAAAGALQIDDRALLDARRIELGLSVPGAELTSESNPLEAGLAWACADDKGCYTGQEIIARQLTYDKVTRVLVGLRSATLLAAGAPLLAEGREVGSVTSAAFSPTLGAPVALAIVRRPHHSTGSRLICRLAGADEVAVEVATLPFVHE